MSMRTIIGAAIAGAIFGIMAPPLPAQSMSTLTNAKRVASNAVAATNEHTSKEQMVGDAPVATAKPGSKPAVAKAAPQPRNTEKRTAAPTRDAAAKPTAPGKKPGAAAATAAGSARPDDKLEKGPANEITLQRESFSYNVDGRRDPFVSLITSGELRPMISDLRLVTVIFDPAGRSVAVMRDVSTQEQYRVKAGQTLGRMRVARIAPKSVMFTIEEYGFSRQEMLTLNDTTRARSQ
jgi:hypothetical protein